MLMRAAGFSSGQKLRHSFRWDRLPLSLSLSLFSLSFHSYLSLCHSFASQDPISPTIISFRKLSIRGRLDLHGFTERTFNWLLAERCFNCCHDSRDRRPTISLYWDTRAISTRRTLDEINSTIFLEVGRSILSSTNLANYFTLLCVCSLKELKESAWCYLSFFFSKD